jgi:multiple sugar transport system substrate-binding protein
MGSTIGGTGIGLSVRCTEPAAALSYIRYLGSPATQKAFALNHGQPAHLDAWEDPAIDARFGGCFTSTLATMKAAWIRPRYAGYLKFQAMGGDLVEHHLRDEFSADQLLDRLQALRQVQD